MLGDQAKSTKYTFWEHFLKQKILNNGNVSLHGRSFKRVSMGLTDRRKTAQNLVGSRKNWKILTVNRK